MNLLIAQAPSTMNWNKEEDVTYEKPFELPKGDFDPHEKMGEADVLYQKRKFSKARDIYEIITYMSKGDTLVKRAQYQLANCYFNMKLYEDAIFEYEQLMRLFPLTLNIMKTQISRSALPGLSYLILLHMISRKRSMRFSNSIIYSPIS